MIKQFKYILLFIFLFLIFNNSVNARYDDNHFGYDAIIMIDDYGNAHITETINCKNADSLGFREIHSENKFDFVIDSIYSSKGIKYIDSEDYDNFFNLKNGYKLDISSNNTEIMYHVPDDDYIILKYTINSFVKNTRDNVQVVDIDFFRNLNFNIIDYANIAITSNKELSKDMFVNSYRVPWDVEFSNNTIKLSATESAKKSGPEPILMVFKNGYFDTQSKVDKNYKNIKIHNFFEYHSALRVLTIVLIAFSIIFIIVYIYNIWSGKHVKFGKKIGKRDYVTKDVLLFRDLPFGDDIHLAYFVAYEYDIIEQHNNYFNALILKWAKEGCVEFIKSDNKFNLKMVKEPKDFREIRLFRLLCKVAGSDQVLVQFEIDEFCKKNYIDIERCYVEDRKETFKLIENSEYITKDYSTVVATSELNTKAMQLAGLKKFFEEFDNVRDKSYIETALWNEYLEYASLFGCAKKIFKEFDNFYPEFRVDKKGVLLESVYIALMLISR